jgi:hypothetical protein
MAVTIPQETGICHRITIHGEGDGAPEDITVSWKGEQLKGLI